MVIPPRRENEIVPQYSLTGDLLSFLRCGLQYRYHNGSSLPPSRPVQLWFGEFIHGVMESAYRLWNNTNPQPAFPWPCNQTPYRGQNTVSRQPNDIGTIGEMVETSLRAMGKNPRNENARNSAYKRAAIAVNELGPHLFPLIESAEEIVIGTRNIPPPPVNFALPPRARLYELHGIIDVLTNVQLTGAPYTNIIKQAIIDENPGLNGQFEVIVDYKGTRRPGTDQAYWNQYDWQIQTYAWLRSKLANALPVAAGVILYINELAPGNDDLIHLKREIQKGTTDVFPTPGSHDYYLLNTWQSGNPIPSFSLEFRLKRTIRIIRVTPQSQTTATTNFDQVVLDIEQCASSENQSGVIINNWRKTGDDDTCAACDFRYFCPDRAPHNGNQTITAPYAP